METTVETEVHVSGKGEGRTTQSQKTTSELNPDRLLNAARQNDSNVSIILEIPPPQAGARILENSTPPQPLMEIQRASEPGSSQGASKGNEDLQKLIEQGEAVATRSSIGKRTNWTEVSDDNEEVLELRNEENCKNPERVDEGIAETTLVGGAENEGTAEVASAGAASKLAEELNPQSDNEEQVENVVAVTPRADEREMSRGSTGGSATVSEQEQSGTVVFMAAKRSYPSVELERAQLQGVSTTTSAEAKEVGSDSGQPIPAEEVLEGATGSGTMDE
ncbi:hypothetical protein R1sor_009896 [Riccia sorocarpa]|uniref:Uncharacterized protein n=1 Tax=Riccia sorocarpa TaxID=122646 RepID=A0ABD3HWD9_9MARC